MKPHPSQHYLFIQSKPLGGGRGNSPISEPMQKSIETHGGIEAKAISKQVTLLPTILALKSLWGGDRKPSHPQLEARPKGWVEAKAVRIILSPGSCTDTKIRFIITGWGEKTLS